jgi:hypothetical protein
MTRFASYQAFLESFEVNDWGDGLPVVPPTPEKVARFLDRAGLAAADDLGLRVPLSAEQIAIVAVLAGCQAEHLPVVIAAVRAHFSRSECAGLGGPALCVIVNGPVRKALDIRCGPQCFGPGFPSNASIGRALDLVVRQAEGPPGGEAGAFSTPDAYSFCFGEDEENGPWEPLHVERGFEAQDSTVTVHSVLASLPSTDITSESPEGVLDTLADTLRSRAAMAGRWPGRAIEPAFIVGAEQQRIFADAGWTRSQMRDHLWQRLSEPRSGGSCLALGDPLDAPIIAAGGQGMSWIWVLVSDALASATVKVEE